MSNYVADTMAIVLYLENRKLPARIKQIFNSTITGGDSTIYISAVSLMEIGYLSEKQRIDADITSILNLTATNKNFKIHDLDSLTVLEGFKITDVPELHDRLIAAAAKVLNATLLTNDPIISRSRFVNSIW